ncbi:MAG: hypothetical protein OI74_09205 [Gammaproteobacteria bacterium (ex Lamellibrachia satsuma)]|nr:MAG: hypothetical protein HPY30_14085 [Gammaproteobacteria bacterium (ex Lamellibrachia satsuma)]RRS33047.1 MAG: hypothetical protein OI74_09205 [Gammaproteobacteria bacterium (ex Lamellibrachia satsuma)]RRS36886.1 MAG: hypothetical protein NV67_04385 [Gammaproteobacteria bacterium (ex Lamellibrachia satsuma)]
MKAIFKPPREPYTGNLLWDIVEARAFSSEITNSLEMLRKKGYWASPFPEGDGVTFTDEGKSKKDIELLNDFRACFDWLEISLDLTFSKENIKTKPAESKLSFEKNVVLSKIEIALTQLEDAIELFITGKRLSVITLAGAADGIFAGLLKQRGDKNAAEDTWKYIEEMRANTGMAYAGDRTKKEAFNEWNEHRNRLKHHDNRDEETLEFSAFDQAYYAIQRANADAEKLGVEAKNRQEYENWLIETIYM